MKTVFHRVSSSQIGSFKLHACAFSKALSSIDSCYRLKGIKRVDSLAKACGYDNHGQLVALARGYQHTEELRLFTPEHASGIAKILHEETGFTYEVVIAAIIKSSAEIYDKPAWKVKDIKTYGNEVFRLLLPNPDKIAKFISPVLSEKLQRIGDIQKQLKPIGEVLSKIPKLPFMFNDPVVFKHLQRMEDTQKQLRPVGEALSKIPKLPFMFNDPVVFKHLQRMEDTQKQLRPVGEALSKIPKIPSMFTHPKIGSVMKESELIGHKTLIGKSLI